jgi:hypothetical protein
MIRGPDRGAVLLGFVALFFLGCGGTKSETEVRPAAAERSRVLARVGEFELRSADVEPLARQAAELHRELGLEVSGDDPVGLAVEFLALLQLDELGDARKRLLARAYLDRMFTDTEPVPVADAELQALHEEEIKKYVDTGESDIYRPTFIDAAAIVIGCFPDLHPPAEDEDPVLTSRQARELAQEIAAACGARVPDLDDFYSVARRFMPGHPTVEFQELGRISKDPRLARISPVLHQTITSLPDNGALSTPVEVPGAVYVLRRGFTDPGKGERLEEIRDVLEERARLLRRRAAVNERLIRLKERYRVRTWPERLRGSVP